jgi:hypothetical protein
LAHGRTHVDCVFASGAAHANPLADSASRRQDGGVTDSPTAPDSPPTDGEGPVVVIGPDGQPVAGITAEARLGERSQDDDSTGITDLVSQPAKVMRIGSMIKQLLDEVKASPLDEASRKRLRDIHQQSIEELEDGLAPELIDELDRLSLPFNDTEVPTDAELRIAQAQLVGWLEGLFHGIQTALFAQQMAARAQFDEMRRHALPPGLTMGPGGPVPVPDEEQGRPDQRTNGPYL